MKKMPPYKIKSWIFFFVTIQFFVACDFDTFLERSLKLLEKSSRSPFVYADNKLFKAINKVPGRFDSLKSSIAIYNAQTGKFEDFAGSSATSTVLDGTGTAASFNDIQALYFTNETPDRIWVLDKCLIRTVNIKTKEVVTVAGLKTATDQPSCTTDQDGSNSTAGFMTLSSITINRSKIYVSSTTRIRQLNIDGTSSTILAGANSSGDVDGNSTDARFSGISSIIFYNNNILVLDSSNNKIKTVNISTGDTTTLFGTGVDEIKDGTQATATLSLTNLSTFTYDYESKIYFTDQNTVRVIDLTKQNIYTLINLENIAEDNTGDLKNARLFYPNFIQWTNQGLFIGNVHGVKLVN